MQNTKMCIWLSAIWNNKIFSWQYLYRQKRYRWSLDEPKQSIKDIVEFNNKSRPRATEGKDKKRYLRKCVSSLIKVEDWWFQKWNISNKRNIGNRLKVLTPKHMFQRLLIALAQMKAGNTSKDLLNKIQLTERFTKRYSKLIVFALIK